MAPKLRSVRRDFAAIEALKTSTWVEAARRHGPARGLAVAGELWLEARALHPDGADPRERQRDLAHHLRLIEALGRVPPCDR